MIINEALFIGIRELKNNNISDSNLKAKLILSSVLDVSKEYILIHGNEEFPVEKMNEYFEDIERVSKGEPLQYVTNIQSFFGMDFYVDRNVLIPQPDTEVLVETAIKIIKKQNKKVEVLDLCTGSGVIAVSVAKQKNTEVTASDISEKALKIAKRNSSMHNTKVNFIKSDLFKNINGKFDIILSNPPYIETEVIKTLSSDVKAEPIIALDGGKDGLDFYREIAQNAKNHLSTNGYLIVEIGNNQKDEVTKILKENGYENIYCIKDYAQNNRVIVSNLKDVLDE